MDMDTRVATVRGLAPVDLQVVDAVLDQLHGEGGALLRAYLGGDQVGVARAGRRMGAEASTIRSMAEACDHAAATYRAQLVVWAEGLDRAAVEQLHGLVGAALDEGTEPDSPAAVRLRRTLLALEAALATKMLLSGCPSCEGEGRIFTSEQCADCAGTGQDAERHLDAGTVPAEVHEGMKLQMPSGAVCPVVRLPEGPLAYQLNGLNVVPEGWTWPLAEPFVVPPLAGRVLPVNSVPPKYIKGMKLKASASNAAAAVWEVATDPDAAGDVTLVSGPPHYAIEHQERTRREAWPDAWVLAEAFRLPGSAPSEAGRVFRAGERPPRYLEGMVVVGPGGKPWEVVAGGACIRRHSETLALEVTDKLVLAADFQARAP